MPPPSTSGTASRLNSPPLVFVVDDQPMLAEMLGFALSAAGFRIRTFEDPQAALETFKQTSPKPDLLVSDNLMPGMSGWELIRQCKVAHPDLKVISASGSILAMPPPSDIQPDGVINKPFSPAELVQMARTVLKN